MAHKIKLLPSLFLLITVACAIHIGPTPPPSPCPIESLMLDAASFHQDIHQTGPPSKEGSPMRFGVNKLGVGFTSMTQGGAIQDVYEGSSLQQTQEKFTDQLEVEFSSREGYTEWYIPEGLKYSSSVADQFQLGCRTHQASSTEICRTIGQYGVYLIIIEVDISSILTHQDMQRLLQTIDAKAAQCLAGKAQ